MSREENGLQKAISRLSGAEGTIHLAELQEAPSRKQAQTLETAATSSEDVSKDSMDKAEVPAVVEGDLEAGKTFELTDQTLVSGTRIYKQSALSTRISLACWQYCLKGLDTPFSPC